MIGVRRNQVTGNTYVRVILLSDSVGWDIEIDVSPDR